VKTKKLQRKILVELSDIAAKVVKWTVEVQNCSDRLDVVEGELAEARKNVETHDMEVETLRKRLDSWRELQKSATPKTRIKK